MIDVGRAYVHGGDLRIGKNLLQIGGRLGNAVSVGELLRAVRAAADDGRDFDIGDRRTFSVCTFPMKPVPTMAVLILAINDLQVLCLGVMRVNLPL